MMLIIAIGPEQALKLASENQFYIIFTDLNMDGDRGLGYRLTWQIKAGNLYSRVFITSSTIVTFIEADSLNAGTSGCIQLPVELPHLEKFFSRLPLIQAISKRTFWTDSFVGTIGIQAYLLQEARICLDI